MKILVYSPRFYPQVGGLENFTLLLCKEWIRQGHFVKVVTQSVADGTDCGVPIFINNNIFQQIRCFFWSDVFYMPNLSLKGIWLLFFNPFKTWVVSHNVWYDGYNSKTEFTAKIKLALLFFCRNISVSKAVAESIPAKSIVIHNAYDRNTFHQNYPTNRSKKLLYVGRLVSDKGVDDLIIAFVQLLTKYPTLSLTIVGDGEERIKIEELVNHYQLQSNIELTGTLKNEVLASVMNAHEVLVVPSKWNEPFGIVALEGLACGCKVVCSNGGGLKEAVGAFGFLFTNGKVDELINVIEQALQTTNNNWNEIDKFLAIHNIEYVAQKYLDVFK